MKFAITARDRLSQARRGILSLPHGQVNTPAFMAIGTVGSVKGVSSEELVSLGSEIILANSYHLELRPTSKYIRRHFGSLNAFMGWPRPILTDSGGFQVFSLGLRPAPEGETKPRLVKISPDGVEFQSHLDGQRHFFTPEGVIEIQRNLGSDILMALDVCTEYPASYKRAKAALELTHHWAERAIGEWQKKQRGKKDQALFGIVQGSTYDDLRVASATIISQLGFDGVAIGGVSVGEGKGAMDQAVRVAIAAIPEALPRYIMGLGEPEDMITAIAAGADLFDCVLPTRLARHGAAWVGDEKEGFSQLELKKSRFRLDKKVLDGHCRCEACRPGYSRAYLHHLVKEREILALRLITLHNLSHVLGLFQRLRTSLESGRFSDQFGQFIRSQALS